MYQSAKHIGKMGSQRVRGLWLCILLTCLSLPALQGCSESGGGLNTPIGSDPQQDATDPDLEDPVNEAPQINDQTLSDLAFADTVAGTITFSDADSDSDDMVFTVTTVPIHGTLSITDHGTGAFQYQPNSVDATAGDSFQVTVSDGEDESSSATITLAFADTSAPVLTLSPSEGASNVPLSTTLTLQADDPIDLSTITFQQASGTCTGTVQISADSFSTCLALQAVTATQLNRMMTVSLGSPLESITEYQFRVTTGVSNRFGLALAEQITQSFTSARADLMISEVSSAYYSDGLHWFELYNPASSVVDLADYRFQSRYLDTGDGFVKGAHTFSLPSVSIQPGQYVVVRAQHHTETYGSNERVVHIKDGNYYPFWTDSGYIDLIKISSGDTVDFVTFGSGYTPTTTSEWTGTFASALPYSANDLGKGLARDAQLTDTNSATDWTLRDWATAGGANDVTCDTDADIDGIPDCSEVENSTFAGLPLYEWGARTGQKDIFIEIDYMDATDGGAQIADEGIVPRKEALQKVVDAFAAQNIAIHFDVGDLHDNASGTDPVDFDLGGGQQVPFADGISFDPADGRANLYTYKRDYMDYSRMQVFHYLIFANSQNLDGTAGSSGLAEAVGNDLLVTLGNWGLHSGNTANTNILINYQASTLMHELGHNLGLLHGGDESTNYKPNYISVMNYLYQLSGLPEIGNDEGDRFYFSSEYHGGDVTCFSALSHGASTTSFIMDFSHGNAVTLDKTALNENLGLGQTGSDAVDYDCDGDRSETSVNFGTGNWQDHDDWSSVDLVFQRSFSGSNQGRLRRLSQDTLVDFELQQDRIGDDRNEIVEETSPSMEFFERLRQMQAE